jgi:hypothetical protein
VLAGVMHTDHAMITSVASIEARGCALVSPHVRDAHGPLPQCTLSVGTRQAKNVGMASLGRQSLPVHTRPSGREESEKGSVGPRLGPFSSSTNCEELRDKRYSRLPCASVPLQHRHDTANFGSLVFPGVQNCANINKLCLHVHVLKC